MTPFIKILYSPASVTTHDQWQWEAIDFGFPKQYLNYTPVEKAIFICRQAFLVKYAYVTTTAQANPSYRSYNTYLCRLLTEQQRVAHLVQDSDDKLWVARALTIAEMLLTNSSALGNMGQQYNIIDEEQLMLCMTGHNNVPGKVSGMVVRPFLQFYNARFMQAKDEDITIELDDCRQLVFPKHLDRCMAVTELPIARFVLDTRLLKEYDVTLRTPSVMFMQAFQYNNVSTGLRSLLYRFTILAQCSEHPDVPEWIDDVLSNGLFDRGYYDNRYLRSAGTSTFTQQYHMSSNYLSDLLSLVLFYKKSRQLTEDDGHIIRRIVSMVQRPDGHFSNLMAQLVQATTGQPVSTVALRTAVPEYADDASKESTTEVEAKIEAMWTANNIDGSDIGSSIESMDIGSGVSTSLCPIVMGPFDFDDTGTASDSTDGPDEDSEPKPSTGAEENESTKEEPKVTPTHTQAKGQIAKLLGIDLTLETTPTLDSVLFRDMVSQAIDAAIEHNTDLSPEQLAVLREIKLQWLYLLDIDTLSALLTKVFARKENKPNKE